MRDRTPSPRRWNLCATIYRALVVAQTLAWAVETLVRITTRAASAAPTRATLAIASIIALGAGLLTYYACRSRWPARAAVLLAWPSFQAAGILALLAYALTPATLHFLVGIATLAVMHAFSPNRFPAPPRPPRPPFA